jgi:hypothetical protein
VRSGATSRLRYDELRSAVERDRARVAEVEAQLRQAQLPVGRDAERKAPKAISRPRRRRSRRPAWRLEQKSVAAPVAGLVHDTYFVEGRSGCRPAGRWPRCCRRATSRCGSTFPKPRLSSLALNKEMQVRCDGCPAAIVGEGELHLGAGRVHAAGSLQQGIAQQAHVPGRGAPRRLEPAPRAAVDVTPDRNEASLAIDVRGLNKSFGAKHVVKDFSLQVRRGEIYGFLGPERQRQDHLDPHDLRPAQARFGRRHLPRPRHPRFRGDQARGRLHDAALLAVGGPHHPREPRVHRAHVRHEEP